MGKPALDQFLQTQVFLQNGPAVIKVHEIGPVALESIRDGRAKAVCTFRDPRDCVASDIAFWGAGIEASIQRVTVSLKALEASYRDGGSTLLVRYEDMIKDRLTQIRRIAAHIPVEIRQNELDWIDAQTDIIASQKICREIRRRPEIETDPVLGGHRRDRVSLLHDNHIGSAKAGRWRDDLTPEQGQRLTRLFWSSLVALGYESDGSIDAPRLDFPPPESSAINRSSGPPC